MVSYMENGQRKKFIVRADRPNTAITEAEKKGASITIKKNVQELNRYIDY